MSSEKTPTYLDTFKELKSVFRLRHSEHVFDTSCPRMGMLWMDRYSDHPNRFKK